MIDYMSSPYHLFSAPIMHSTDYKEASAELFAARQALGKAQVALKQAEQWVIAAKRNHDDVLHGRDAEWLFNQMFNS